MGMEEQAPNKKHKKPGNQSGVQQKQKQQKQKQRKQLSEQPQAEQLHGPPQNAIRKRKPAQGQTDVAQQPSKKARHSADKQQQPPGPQAEQHPSTPSSPKPHAGRSPAAKQQNKPAYKPAMNPSATQHKPHLPSASASAPHHHPRGSARPSIHSSPAAPALKHAFEVDDPRDHAETPFEAYRDLEPLLFRLAQQLGKPKASLRIYDPYFCAGSCVAHLSRLGFTDVYNRNEDFYSAQERGSCPDFDVLVTNPPFSGDHMRRALDFAARCGRPYALLMPDFVARKAYYAQVLELPGSAPPGQRTRPDQPQAGAGPDAVASPLCGPLHYLAPGAEPYKFSAPHWHAEGPGASGSAAAPQAGKVFTPASFQCVWFLALGASNAGPVTSWWRKKLAAGGGAATGAAGAVLSADVKGLPQLSLDPNRKRREEEAGKRLWRKKLSRQRKNAAKAQARDA